MANACLGKAKKIEKMTDAYLGKAQNIEKRSMPV
jgi:hypothetical protein